MEEASRGTRGLTKSWNRRLDTLCDRFEETWRNGAGIDVAAFLDTPEAAATFREISGEDQSALLRELTAVAWDRHGRPEEPSRFVACKRRFPQHAAMLDELLGELAAAAASTAGLESDELERRIAAAGLMSADELARFRARLSPEARAGGTVPLAVALTQRGKVTSYQLRWLAAPTRTPLVLGNYVIRRRLGGGGIGDVFLARHRRMGRQVALKVLRPEIAADPAARNRFDREVQVAALLSHPNIVTAHDSDEVGGVPFLVMEFIPGIDLSDLVKLRGRLTPPQAVGLIAQAARGLEYAHRAGVIHRDVKPANLMLSVEGYVKVMDMGLARADQVEDDCGAGLTQTGQVMGTFLYMAPEQAIDTKSADPRADIYGLGCTLHFLLAGKPPYQGRSAMETLLAHREQPIPSLTGLHPQVGPALDVIFRRMLAKRREDRYESMTAARIDLENCGILPETPTDVLYAAGLIPTPPSPSVRAERAGTDSTSFAAAVRGNAPDAAPGAAADATASWENFAASAAAIPRFGVRAGQARADNSLGMKFVWCPPGRFLMGSPATDREASPDEMPQSEVTLTQGFWLGKFAVTQGEWREVMGTEPWLGQSNVKEEADCPATFVSWVDAEAFCRKLTERDAAAGKFGSGWSYRLPTEAEWEYGCRAGTPTRYSFGDDAAELGLHAWFERNAWAIAQEKFAHRVGHKRPNGWGLHDMHGNVCEWCGDTYGEKLPGGRDPVGPPDGTDRVFRGGGWSSEAARCRSAYRRRGAPTVRGNSLGFRVVRIAEA